MLRVSGFDSEGRVRLADESVLLTREMVHGYALTSHASQGMTVDAVFMANPITREGLYVSATRGRERIRIFTSDRPSLLEAARLRSEERMSGMEFSRMLPACASRSIDVNPHTLRSLWANGIEHGRELAIACLKILRPVWSACQDRQLQQDGLQQNVTQRVGNP